MIKALIIFLILISSSLLYGQEIKISTLEVNCGKGKECEGLKENFKTLRRTYANLEHLQTVLKLYVINEGISKFNYTVENNQKIVINLVPKKIVSSVDVVIRGKDLGYPSILPLKEDDFLDESKIIRTKSLLKEIYRGKGFPYVAVEHEFSKNIEDGVAITFVVNTGKPILVNEINIISDSSFLKSIVQRRLSSFMNEPFDIQEVKNTLEDVRVLFLSYGFYLVQLNLKYKLESDNKATLFVDLKNGDLHKFDVRITGEEDINTVAYKDLLSETVITYKRILGKQIIEQLIKERLKKEAYLFSDVKVDLKEYRSKEGDLVHLYKINITKGVRSYINDLEFQGNYVFSSDFLKKLFYENAFEQASRNIFDEQYYKNFQEILRQKYIEKGYVNAFIEQAHYKILPKSKNINLAFRVREGLPAKITKVSLLGLPTDLRKFLLKKMKTKSKNNFDPVTFKEDLEVIEKEIKKQGFYFSRIANKTSNNIVVYNKDNSQVFINIEIELDKRLFVNNLIIIGNRKTKIKFIKREIFLHQGDIVTPQNIDNSQTNLLSSGLFSSVNIKPVKNVSNKADILISVREKDFGLVEIAPGVRTDIGPKLAAKVSYNNLGGMNRRILFKGQVNQRFNLNSLDEVRRERSNSLIEYSSLLNYSENYIFDTPLDFSTSLTKSRKRFFSFDADIQKISFTTSYSVSRRLRTSLTYRLETISQFDSTLEREQGHFQIGALTPGVTWDLRNNRINPTKGAYFSLTYELANPTFLSQSNDDLVVNYYKMISRNRFYIPMPNGVFAISTALGYEKNLATAKKADGSTEGYIPNIKVFRLTGMDIVRGFEDNEINRLVTGQDISEALVDNSAYMVNLKVEPRVFLSDSSMLGVFYDAGRVFVGSYDLSQLRSSAGLSFKYLTPVGTLNFDYGIKLLRKRDADGRLENPGRLHVSIGFF